MNLENFPTSETAKEMMSTISAGFYSESYIGKWLFQVMGMELDDAKMLFDELRLQIFPETATWGIRYHEEKYGIISNEALDLEVRRKEVLLRRAMRLPMNPARLENILIEQIGVDVSVIELYAAYCFKVLICTIDFDTGLNEIRKTINKLKPSHLSFGFWFDNIMMYSNDERLILEKVDFSFSFLWLKELIDGYMFDGSWLLNGIVQLTNNTDLMPTGIEYITKLKSMDETFDDFELETKSADFWCLDGSVVLDGSKKLVTDRKEIL